MNPIKWLIPIACISTSMLAQTANDLNGLVAAAAHYVSSGLAGTHDTESLVLGKIIGNNGSQAPTYLMTKATDVQHWTFLYQVNGARPGDVVADPQPKPHLSAQAECTQGVFKNFHFSDQPVKGVKSLEFTWVAVSLDNAIANLNANGFVRGFSSVELMRPDLANWPDDYVYVFNCPWERQEVGISCQTGAMAWSYSY
jgi:hypothetical protein